MEICGRCGRKLKTQKSIDDGYGPVCKRKHEEAEAEFLKRQITMEQIVGESACRLALTAKSTKST